MRLFSLMTLSTFLLSCIGHLDVDILPSDTGTSVADLRTPTWIPELNRTPFVNWKFVNVYPTMDMQVALGTAAGGSDILPWTSVSANAWSSSDLMFADNQKVFPTVRVIDSTGYVRALEKGKGWVPSSNGAGAYEAYRTLPVTGGVRQVASEDLNNDGYPDFVSADGGNGFFNISVILTNSDGTYKPAVTYAVTNNPQMISIKDVTGDGLWDLIAGTYSGSIHVLKGNGQGQFAAHDVLTFGTSLTSIDFYDFNKDGSLDLILSRDVGSNTVEIRLNDGQGRFSLAGPHRVVAVPARPKCVVVGDFNNDGEVDFAVSSYQQPITRIVWGGALPHQDLTVGTESLGLEVADLNGDGYLDLVTSEATLHKIHIYWGSSTTVSAVPTVLDSRGRPLGLTIADINKDGHLDIISSSNTTVSSDPGFATLGVYLGDSKGNFSLKFEIPVAGSSYRPIVKDINLDGRPDLVVGTGGVISYLIAK